MYPETASHPSFTLQRSREISSLGVTMLEYEHLKTGAKHYHLASEHQENVFLVAFRTVPMDSTGVAHILEHTALCGSDRFPVRDPFFMMTRRSLNTFMNAMTSSDWTAYPFASQNRKDFYNLLDVYLDATFHSRLDPLDFAQEGHRVEFSEPNNPNSPLVYKGVVLNEMKGAMSSPISTLWQTLGRYLFPTTTYHYNSGGDPESITDLSYEQLVSFYKSHYHPSNAIFMTFGNLPPAELQQYFEEKALSDFERLDDQIEVADEKRYFAPLRVEESYALDEESLEGRTHHVMGWLLGRSIDLEAQLKAELLNRVLLDNSASPLRHALESSELGSAPSPLCGLEDSNREMTFMCGLEGSEPEHAAAFEALILSTLEKVAEEGVPQEMLEAQLHQLELMQREIGGDGHPYGLSLIMSAMPSAIHRGDPIALLDLDPVLEALREQIQQPDFIQNLVKGLLLDNVHRVRLTLRPDNHFSARQKNDEAAKLEAIRQSLTDSQREQILQQTVDLEKRQKQLDNEDILPKVTIADVPADMHIPVAAQPRSSSLPLSCYDQGTNGLVYQQIIVQLPELTDTELELLPLYTSLLPELGCGGRTYRENQQYQAQVSGGIGCYSSIRGSIESEQQISASLTLSGKALAKNQQQLAKLLQETLSTLRFDEHSRIAELISQQRSRRVQGITGHGHSFAIGAAVSQMSPSAALMFKSSGLESIRLIKALDERIKNTAELDKLSTQLEQLHSKILSAPREFLSVAEAEHQKVIAQSLEQLWQPQQATEFAPLQLSPVREPVRQLWATSTQVSFCAMAFPTVSSTHPDSAPLVVLGEFLRNGYLHRAVREQGGAYGAGAGQDSAEAAFRFYSYRDPRLLETFEAFHASIQWLLTEKHDPQKLEEAVLGIVSSIDKPSSPAGEAKQAFHSALQGRTAEFRRNFRKNILAVSLDDLHRVAETYFDKNKASVAAVTSWSIAEPLKEQFEVIKV